MRNFCLAAANYLGEKLELAADDRAVIAYGLEVVFSNLVTLLLILVGSMIFGILKEVVIAAFTWFIIRQSAGGAHCSTLEMCF